MGILDFFKKKKQSQSQGIASVAPEHASGAMQEPKVSQGMPVDKKPLANPPALSEPTQKPSVDSAEELRGKELGFADLNEYHTLHQQARQQVANDTITTVPPSSLRERLAHRCKYKPSRELNFILDHHDHMACFLGNTFYITDLRFNVLCSASVAASVNACAISDDGRFALFQTANARTVDSDDGGLFFLFDVLNNTTLWKRSFESGWKGLSSLFIDSITQTIVVYYNSDAYHLRYSFHGDLLDTVLWEQIKFNPENGSNISPYSLNAEALNLMLGLKAHFDTNTYNKIVKLLSTASSIPQMSTYQLSMSYKELADICYQENLMDFALTHYQAGLALNPKLSVKRKIKELSQPK